MQPKASSKGSNLATFGKKCKSQMFAEPLLATISHLYNTFNCELFGDMVGFSKQSNER